MKKRGRITHLWVKRCGVVFQLIPRWMILSTTGILYSQRIRSTKPVYKQVYTLEGETKLHYSIQYAPLPPLNPRTSIIQLKTGNGPICKLKALNPESVQNWVTRIQSLIAKKAPTPTCFDRATHHSRKRSPLRIETETEKAQPPVYPTPVGKRDYDISASSLRQKVLNKKGKDYSTETASTIQKEYKSSKSTREAILEAHKQSRSATNILEAEERLYDRGR